MLNVVLAPDVFVNASLALGSPPDQVVQRVLGNHKGECKCSEWVMERVGAMLAAVPSFKKEAVDSQLTLIRQFVQVIKDDEPRAPDAWEASLVALAKAAGVKRVITDHPDLLQKESSEGIDFISTEVWLVEQAIPPMPPERISKMPPK